MVAAGLPAAVAPILVGFGEAARLGALELVTTAVADLTGREPASLADLLAAAADELLGSVPAAG